MGSQLCAASIGAERAPRLGASSWALHRRIRIPAEDDRHRLLHHQPGGKSAPFIVCSEQAALVPLRMQRMVFILGSFSWLEWCFYTLASGLYPTCRHDGPWRLGEKGSEFAGQPLGFKGAMVILKGDWAEFAVTLGFRNWAHHRFPCFKCVACAGSAGDTRKFEDCSVFGISLAGQNDGGFLRLLAAMPKSNCLWLNKPIWMQ